MIHFGISDWSKRLLLILALSLPCSLSAEWYTDPEDPYFINFQLSSVTDLHADGLGGAYLITSSAFQVNSHWILHFDANGNMTFPDGPVRANMWVGDSIPSMYGSSITLSDHSLVYRIGIWEDDVWYSDRLKKIDVNGQQLWGDDGIAIPDYFGIGHFFADTTDGFWFTFWNYNNDIMRGIIKFSNQGDILMPYPYYYNISDYLHGVHTVFTDHNGGLYQLQNLEFDDESTAVSVQHILEDGAVYPDSALPEITGLSYLEAASTTCDGDLFLFSEWDAMLLDPDLEYVWEPPTYHFNNLNRYTWVETAPEPNGNAYWLQYRYFYDYYYRITASQNVVEILDILDGSCDLPFATDNGSLVRFNIREYGELGLRFTASVYDSCGNLIREDLDMFEHDPGYHLFDTHACSDGRGGAIFATGVGYGASILGRITADGYLGVSPHQVTPGETTTALPEQLAIDLYPNPFNAEVRISLKGEPVQSITISDILGRTVYDRSFPEHPTRVQFEWNGSSPESSFLASGVYFLRITTEQTAYVKRLMLVR